MSDPCIEYWFLLHFEYTRSPFVGEGKKSRGDIAVERLKQFIPEYKKGDLRIGFLLEGHFDFAFANAQRSLEDAVFTGEDNPPTSVHLLINRLRDLTER
jgi:hypothetical protein